MPEELEKNIEHVVIHFLILNKFSINYTGCTKNTTLCRELNLQYYLIYNYNLVVKDFPSF